MSHRLTKTVRKKNVTYFLLVLGFISCLSFGNSTHLHASPNTSFAAEESVTKVQWVSSIIELSTSMRKVGQYSGYQLRGKPNIGSRAGDTNPCSWAAFNDGAKAKSTDKAFIRVGFKTPVKARQVAIAENLNPGAITRVMVYGENGEVDTVYRAKPQRMKEQRHRMLNIFFAPPKFKVKEVGLISQYGAVAGWNEIDAIALGTSLDTIKAEINLVSGYDQILPKELQNLGPNINSEYNELLPIISPDGNTLYFCRTGHPENFGINKREDIWYSERQENGQWGPAKNIGEPLNNRHSNFPLAILPDGNTLIVGNTYERNGKTAPGISKTVKTPSGWSFPETMKIRNFRNRGEYVNYFVAADGKTLLLAMRHDTSYGGMDLYVSFLEDDGEVWTAPMNIGNVVNTASDEASVFLASDGKTLYFSSDGHNGYGKNDIFVTRRVDSTWKLWTEPQNLGPVINTTGWDAYFSVPASGKQAVFVSSENTYGKQDLFRVPMKAGLRPNPVVLVSGKVLDASTNEPLQAEIVFEKLDNGKEMGIARSNPVTGEYKISLPAGVLYGLRAEVDEYIPINESIDTRKLTEYEERNQNLLLIPLKKDQVVRLNNIFFDTGESKLKKQSRAELQRVVEMLKSKSSMRIEIMGHTDNVGEKNKNKSLSQERANSVMQFLIEQGIENTRLNAVGFGDSQPVAPNTSASGKRKNRRVEFKILSSGNE